MKRFLSALIAASLLAASLPVLADRGGHDRGRHGGWQQREHGYYHHDRHHHQNRSNPLIWGAAGLALGSIIFSVETPRPAPIVVAPAISVAPPPPQRLWYYCDSLRAYYPYVEYCPGGWRPVPAY